MGFIANMIRGSNGKPRVVERDGGKFLFTPGENGSTRQLSPILPKGPDTIAAPPQIAKSIMGPISSMPVVPPGPPSNIRFIGRMPGLGPVAPAAPPPPAIAQPLTPPADNALARRLYALKNVNGRRLFGF